MTWSTEIFRYALLLSWAIVQLSNSGFQKARMATRRGLREHGNIFYKKTNLNQVCQNFVVSTEPPDTIQTLGIVLTS
jgi:hypothetical protein